MTRCKSNTIIYGDKIAKAESARGFIFLDLVWSHTSNIKIKKSTGQMKTVVGPLGQHQLESTLVVYSCWRNSYLPEEIIYLVFHCLRLCKLRPCFFFQFKLWVPSHRKFTHQLYQTLKFLNFRMWLKLKIKQQFSCKFKNLSHTYFLYREFSVKENTLVVFQIK